jgi:hypothetical protein
MLVRLMRLVMAHMSGWHAAERLSLGLGTGAQHSGVRRWCRAWSGDCLQPASDTARAVCKRE